LYLSRFGHSEVSGGGQIKAGLHLNLSEIFKKFKEGIEGRKLFLKHHQKVHPNARASQAVRGLFGCPSTIFSL